MPLFDPHCFAQSKGFKMVLDICETDYDLTTSTECRIASPNSGFGSCTKISAVQNPSLCEPAVVRANNSNLPLQAYQSSLSQNKGGYD